MAQYGYKPVKYGQPRSTQKPSQADLSYWRQPARTPAKSYYSPPAGRIEQGGYKVPARPAAAPPAAQPADPAVGGQQPQANQQAPLYDYNADPILQKVRALKGRGRDDARSGAQAARKQLAVDYGDASILGDLTGDDPTFAAAQGNPFGVTQLLRRDYDSATRDADEGYNKANLFYSGARGQGLADLARGYQENQAGALGQFRGALSGVDSELTGLLMQADADEIAAEEGARERALAQSLRYGVDPGQGAPGGGGGTAAGLTQEDASNDSIASMLSNVPQEIPQGLNFFAPLENLSNQQLGDISPNKTPAEIARYRRNLYALS